MGEYGFEDIINPPDQNGLPDNVFHASEDVNQNGVLDIYGAAHLGDAFGVANGDPTIRIDCNSVGRKNRVSGPRHGLKVVNGSLGNLPTRPDGTGGFTVASENAVYVQGNYNSDDSGFGDPHAAAAVIADAATFLSKNWQDWHSFVHPTYRGSSTLRLATTSYYRLAVAAGKKHQLVSPRLDHQRGLWPGRGNSQFSPLPGTLEWRDLQLQRFLGEFVLLRVRFGHL